MAPLDPLLQNFFSGNYVLNSYGGVINQRGSLAYVHNIHRDVRFTSDTRRFMLNVLVMLDDFTVENGATHLLSGSQNSSTPPDKLLFSNAASRATGLRGSILLFDSRIWHAAGTNITDQPRR